ncbi:hypothetical protein JJE00_04440 [Candidatus Bathyarchaeota archaeon]|nr:hypothetical protein [Candidatus Bathyarchaeota archaeon]
MNSIKIEWQKGENWHSIRLPVLFSKTGFYYVCNSKNTTLIWKNFSEGTPVISRDKTNDKWQKVGRIAQYKHIFLGEGKSYTEHLDEKHKDNIQSYLQDLIPNIEA